MSKEVQELFTSIAPKYDFLNHFLSLSTDRRWRDKALRALAAHPPEKVLDLCAGTLDLCLGIMARFPRAQITALDFSYAMLQMGQQKLSGSKRVSLVCADGHDLPFPPKHFDAVVCGFGIRNLENRQRAAEEIFRVLKPGGRLVVLEFFRPQKIFPKWFYRTYGKIVLPWIGGWISRNRQAYSYLHNSIHHFLSVEEYRRLLADCGFHNIAVRAFSGGIAHQVLAEVPA